MITLIKSLITIFKLLLLTTVIIYLANFVVNNDAYVTINLEPLPYEITTKIFIIMIGFFVAGLVVSLLISTPKNIACSFKEFNSERKIKSLNKKLIKELEKTKKEIERNQELERKIAENKKQAPVS